MLSRLNPIKPSARGVDIGRRILIVEDEFVVANDLQLMLEKAGYNVLGIAASVKEAQDFIKSKSPDIVLLDIFLKGDETGIDLSKQLIANHIPYIYLSANSNQSVLEQAKATQPFGFLVKPFREKDVLVTLEVALYRQAHSAEARLRKEQELQIALSDTLSAAGEWEQRLLQVARHFQDHIPFDFLITAITKNKDPYQFCGFFRTGFDEYQIIRLPEIMTMTGLKLEHLQKLYDGFMVEDTGLFNGDAFTKICRGNPVRQLIARTFKVSSRLMLPLQMAREGTFILSFYNRDPEAYQPEHLALLQQLEKPLAHILDRLMAFEEIEKLSDQLQREKHYLEEEVKTGANFDEIVGTSRSLLQVFDQVSQVASADTSVLILGESGTGKELIARSIHNLSPRKAKILVKVNCAALPANLFESELFGHEKGAFTGAIDRRIGKFELANGGSIFLDEIGELPLELQSKLLRVLQEKEIERLGGKGPIKIDVRIIAATNRNLENEVAAGRFRLDLYYRLSVFPIHLPALRERIEDIPLLGQFFAQKFCRKIGKPYRGIKETAMAELLHYEWPGNIRELENVIEQSVIINNGNSPLEWGRPLINKFLNNKESAQGQTLYPTPNNLLDVKLLQQETEREYILSVLKNVNGRIRGKNGAAEILNLKPTTLESRMEKLGIKKLNFI